MYTVPLPLGVKQIAVDKYIISYHTAHSEKYRTNDTRREIRMGIA